MPNTPVVRFIVEDPGVRAAFVSLLTQADYCVEAFATPADFWASYDLSRPGCVVLDVGIGPTESTTAFVRDPRLQHPVVVITASEDHGELDDIGPRASVVHALETQDFVRALDTAMQR